LIIYDFFYLGIAFLSACQLLYRVQPGFRRTISAAAGKPAEVSKDQRQVIKVV
jgi:hypothetical protein